MGAPSTSTSRVARPGSGIARAASSKRGPSRSSALPSAAHCAAEAVGRKGRRPKLLLEALQGVAEPKPKASAIEHKAAKVQRIANARACKKPRASSPARALGGRQSLPDEAAIVPSGEWGLAHIGAALLKDLQHEQCSAAACSQLASCIDTFRLWWRRMTNARSWSLGFAALRSMWSRR